MSFNKKKMLLSEIQHIEEVLDLLDDLESEFDEDNKNLLVVIKEELVYCKHSRLEQIKHLKTQLEADYQC